MRTITKSKIFCFAGLLAGAAVCCAQFGRGDASWATPGADAQRSGWVRSDPKISVEGVQKPEFRFLWKMKLADRAGKTTALTPAVLLTKYIGYRGFRDLALVESNSDSVYGVDTDLGRMEWNVHIGQPASGNCPAGLSAGLARPIQTAIPAPPGASGPGRGEPAHSAVGQPGEGAVTLRTAAAITPRPAAPPAATVPAAPVPAPPVPARRRMTPITIYVLDGQGKVHSLYVSNGLDDEPPVQLVPPNSAARGFIVANQVAYAAAAACSDGAGSIHALDLESKKLLTWDAGSPLAGAAGPAFGPDGTLYAATEGGNLVALDAATLKVKDTFNAKQPFITSPIVFNYQQKVLVAAVTKDGSIQLLDTASLGGEDNSTPLLKSPPDANLSPGSLASFQDRAGKRWILAPVKDAIAAWQIHDENGQLTLVPAWKADGIAAPSAPIIINGVVFAASNSASNSQSQAPATIYALDGASGRKLWNSGSVITASAHHGSLSGGGSQIYLGADDGTLWVFGSWIERQ
jgi:outer membrane protein assembly factor BamB